MLRDLVINGPDHTPAIKVGALHLKIALMPLMSHRARLDSVIAEDVDATVVRDADGELELAHLVRPGPRSGPRSGWSVEIPKLALHRGHVALDTGTELANLDGIEIFGAAHIPQRGLRGIDDHRHPAASRARGCRPELVGLVGPARARTGADRAS
jgi:hypothetical protein